MMMMMMMMREMNAPTAAPAIPKQPKDLKRERENESHRLTPLPFISRCPDCVSGNGVDGHIRYPRTKKEQEIPTFSVDYLWMNQASSELEEQEGQCTNTLTIFPVLRFISFSRELLAQDI